MVGRLKGVKSEAAFCMSASGENANAAVGSGERPGIEDAAKGCVPMRARSCVSLDEGRAGLCSSPESLSVIWADC